MIYSLKYTDNIKEGFGGYARAWFIRIRPKYINDEGILEHEKTHVHQFWRTLGFHGLLLLSKKYRFKIEVEAYKKQLLFPPAILGSREIYINHYASALALKYNLGITIEEAKEALS